LNMDPYNLYSEELALAECMRGLEIRRVWSEREMVCTFGGQMLPGTPDGMFESWDGVLTCVQVVRVPLLDGMSQEYMHDVIAQTIVTKVVKSQQWLRACRVVSCDFVIFCWLPFLIPESLEIAAEALMQRVRELDERFSLCLRVPAEPGALFPSRFATTTRECNKTMTESDVCAFTTTGYVSDDDEEELSWDITWSWDEDQDEANSVMDNAVDDGDFEAEVKSEVDISDEECDVEWDLTWDWQQESAERDEQDLATHEFGVHTVIPGSASSVLHHDDAG